jgi:putative DNA primase/helicase
MPPEVANPMRLETWMLDWCKREGVDRVSTKMVQQFGPGGLREKAIIDATVNELADLGRARLIKDGKKKLIQIRPDLLVTAS